MNVQAGTRAVPLREDLACALTEELGAERDDPFRNPILHFAVQVGDRLAGGEIAIAELAAVVGELTSEAFVARAERFRRYLGETDPDANAAALSALFEALAGEKDFDAFQQLVARADFGIVFTAHPTFSLNEELSHALVELGTGYDDSGRKLTEAERETRIAVADGTAHCPPETLTLEVEHQWSIAALRTAHGALDEIYRLLFRLARARWPERWTELAPRLVTLASWVGYDQDGRTDITWTKTIQKRLVVKQRALERHRETLARLRAKAPPDFAIALAPVLAAIDAAWSVGAEQIVLLGEAQEDRRAVPDFARALVKGRDSVFADPAPLIAQLRDLAKAAPDDESRETLLVMAASLEAHGVSLADTHVRVNAVQLHNAIRRQVGLGASPNDPTSRRTLFNTINELIATAKPVQINFGSVMEERASAKRLMMTIAEIVKHIDAKSPVRFLIAETESAFTLLTALYYARLFGIEDHVEISPLFETEEALDSGERVIEEALKSPHYVAYLKKIGRISMQFGYSDSGRFIGQMAATFRIERLRLRLAQLLQRHGLGALKVILFNTHGESLGRGGHPVSMADRFRYLAPPMSRWEFTHRGIRAKEEVSFQGGDGYLYFFTRPAALATLRHALEFSFEHQPSPEATADPIYGAADYASEFFATVQQEFARLVDDPDYVALLDLFGANLLSRAGSRPQLRQHGAQMQPGLARVAELRAIPNNARLQQLGHIANLLYGVGRAAAKDKDLFHTMRESSPRFRRAFDFVLVARELSDLNTTRSYVDVTDPGLWLSRAAAARSEGDAVLMRELRDLTEALQLHDGLLRVWRKLRSDDLLLAQVLSEEPASPRRGRVLLLHALRAALIQYVCVLAMRIPDFSPQHGMTLAEIRARLLRLELPDTIEQLREIFPRSEDESLSGADFGEVSTYRPDAAQSYAVEHEMVFKPLLDLYGLIRRISGAITHECGASG